MITIQKYEIQLFQIVVRELYLLRVYMKVYFYVCL